MAVRQSDRNHTQRLSGMLIISLILSAATVIGFTMIYFQLKDPDYWPLLLISALHLITIVLVILKKRAGRIVGILAWLPLCFGLIGIWGLMVYAMHPRTKQILVN